MPRNLEPMLATPAQRAAGRRRLGVRDQVGRDARAAPSSPTAAVRIAARRGTDAHAAATPSWRRSARRCVGREAILDGEIVAFDDAGRPSFQLLQRRMGLSNEVDDPRPRGRDPGDLRRLRPALARRPLAARRAVLRSGASCSPGSSFDGPSWQAPAHHVGDGERLWEAIQRAQGLEGIVAKRLGSPYRPGQRSREWLKVRYRRGQELVIGGWMPGEGSARRPGRVAAGRPLGRDPGGGRAPRPPAAARLRGRRRDRLHAGDARPAHGRCWSRFAATTSPFELGEDPRGQVRAAGPRPRRRPGLGRAGAGLRGRVHASGRARAPCANRRSRACATTRTRARWSGRREGRDRRSIGRKIAFAPTE